MEYDEAIGSTIMASGGGRGRLFRGARPRGARSRRRSLGTRGRARGGRLRPRPRSPCVGGDEALRVQARLIVRSLVVGRLHQIGGGAVELPGDAVVER